MKKRIKKIDLNADELHACGLAMMEILLERNSPFVGDDCVIVRIPVIMPDESKHIITIIVGEDLETTQSDSE